MPVFELVSENARNIESNTARLARVDAEVAELGASLEAETKRVTALIEAYVDLLGELSEARSITDVNIAAGVSVERVRSILARIALTLVA